VPNSSANAAAVRFLDKDCSIYEVNHDRGDPRPVLDRCAHTHWCLTSGDGPAAAVSDPHRYAFPRWVRQENGAEVVAFASRISTVRAVMAILVIKNRQALLARGS
jgi:hypothetical protein